MGARPQCTARCGSVTLNARGHQPPHAVFLIATTMALVSSVTSRLRPQTACESCPRSDVETKARSGLEGTNQAPGTGITGQTNCFTTPVSTAAPASKATSISAVESSAPSPSRSPAASAAS